MRQGQLGAGGTAQIKAISFPFDDPEPGTCVSFPNQGLGGTAPNPQRQHLGPCPPGGPSPRVGFGSAKVKALMSEVMSRWVYRGPPPFLVLAPPRLHLPLPSQFSLQEAALCGKKALGGAGTSKCVFLFVSVLLP